ncbi:hypothetical protein [Mucilaginibacter sp.]|uniref:hypothetical protein n=1 Tax=Mucilaginibacter sp. TaxID=1882438 RepID=UPI003AFFEC42
MTYAILFVVIIIIGYFLSRQKSKTDEISTLEQNERSKNESFFSSVIQNETSENGKKSLINIKKVFDDGESYNYLDLLYKSGVPHEIAYSKNSNLINSYLGFKKDISKDLFNVMSLDISERNRLATSELPTIKDAFSKFKVALKDNEILHYQFNNIYMFQEKTIKRNVNYSGVRWNNGPLRMGNVTYSTNDIKDWLPQDFGRLFITNKRIIFVGKQKNISEELSINSIVDYYVYKDGILICRNKRKNLLFKESQFKNYGQPADDYAFIMNDFPVKFTTIINRIAN